MKRRDIIKALLAAGFELREGAKHTHILWERRRVSVLSRQSEIDDIMVRKIEKQTGVTLR